MEIRSENKDWNKLANYILDEEAKVWGLTEPPITGILLRWRVNGYTGGIQVIYPQFSREIAFLSKTSKPVEEELYNAIKRNDPGRVELIADDSIDLEGNYHTLRKLENRLVSMTPEQTGYALSHPIRGIAEIIPGKGQ
jgi:hypothetical protein